MVKFMMIFYWTATVWLLAECTYIDANNGLGIWFDAFGIAYYIEIFNATQWGI
tara:strand:- start:445 stop:603 length:159 start_codon:yes stop_codon:yes gene_type:complete